MKQQIYIILIFPLVLQTSATLNDFFTLLIQKKFQYDMLNTHNILRKQHCASPLILDDRISEKAQAYAEYLANRDSSLVHSDRKGLLGENLYSATSSKPILIPDCKIFIFYDP
jgi:uncharacterized protein YkwD